MKIQWCSAHRVAECQSRGMKGLARGDPLQGLGPPASDPGDPSAASPGVDRVTHDRVPHVLQMHSDLMGAAGMELQPKQVDHVEPGHHRSVGAGLTALRRHTHSLSVALASGDRRLDADRTVVQMAPREGRIAPMHPTRRDGGTELPVGEIGLGNDHEARRVPIEPMDDSRPPFGTSGQCGPPRHQGVDQGVIPMTGRRVNYQAGGLIDDGKVLVFENKSERNCGRLERSGRFVVRDLNRYDLTPGKEPGGAGDFAGDCNPLVRYETRGLGPRDGHLVGEKPVQALGLLTDNSECDFAPGICLGLGV